MGELIYCRHQIAANPLYIEDSSHNIYSLEELCYYIRENPYLVTEELMSSELCDWIRDELLDEELGSQLSNAIEEGSPLHLFVARLLSGCGYLTTKEIRDTVDIIERFERLTEDERKKVHADELLKAKKLSDAIFYYDSILSSNEKLDDALRADICHNRGTAFAWLFFFEEASKSFEEAFTYGKKIESLQGMLLAAALMEDDSRFKLLAEKYHISENGSKEIRDKIDLLGRSREISDFSATLKRLRSDYSDQSAYMEQIMYYVSGFSEEYKKVSGN